MESEEAEADFFAELAAGAIEKMREAFPARPVHFLHGSCWCEPVVQGNVVKHNLMPLDNF